MRRYASAVCGGVAAAVMLDQGILHTRLLNRRSFWAAYGIMLAGQLAVNGTLTGRRIVRYDPQVTLGARVAAAPVEDLGFGFVLVTATLSAWTAAGRRAPAGTPAAPRRGVGGPAR